MEVSQGQLCWGRLLTTHLFQYIEKGRGDGFVEAAEEEVSPIIFLHTEFTVGRVLLSKFVETLVGSVKVVLMLK